MAYHKKAPKTPLQYPRLVREIPQTTNHQKYTWGVFVELIPKAIVKQREVRLWSQRELARRVGVSQAYLSDVENGKVIVSMKLLARICKAFDCAINIEFVPFSYLFHVVHSGVSCLDKKVMSFEEDLQSNPDVKAPYGSELKGAVIPAWW